MSDVKETLERLSKSNINKEDLVQFLEDNGLRESALLLKTWNTLDVPALELIEELEKASKKDIWNQTVKFLEANKNKKTQNMYNLPSVVGEKLRENEMVENAKAKAAGKPEPHIIDNKKEVSKPTPPERKGDRHGETVTLKTPVWRSQSWTDESGELHHKRILGQKNQDWIWDASTSKWNAKQMPEDSSVKVKSDYWQRAKEKETQKAKEKPDSYVAADSAEDKKVHGTVGVSQQGKNWSSEGKVEIPSKEREIMSQSSGTLFPDDKKIKKSEQDSLNMRQIKELYNHPGYKPGMDYDAIVNCPHKNDKGETISEMLERHHNEVNSPK